MDFEDALGYVQGRLRLGIKLGNERFLALLERLGNPQNSLQVIHIAGTKGKGSTATMVGSILTTAGYRTGVYLSPYVYDVRERIAIDGVPIPHEDFARWVTVIRPHVEALEETEHGPTTEFELKTAVGFCYFAEQQVDYAVVEVGIGGRLDATNIFPSPLVTAITTIGYDHVELLGPTLADIAREKAGIVKAGIPCVTGVTQGSEAYEAIAEICAARRAPVVRVALSQNLRNPSADVDENDAFSDDRKPNGVGMPIEDGRPTVAKPPLGSPYGHGTRSVRSEVDYEVGANGSLSVQTPVRRLDGLRLRLQGSFQHANAATAVGALDAIRDDRRPKISDEQARVGLESAYLPGRFEQIAAHPTIYVDVAHNELSAQALAVSLREAAPRPDMAGARPQKLVLVVGLSRAHEPGSFLDPLLALRPAAVIATQPNFRPRDAHETASVAASAKIDDVRVVDTSVADACREALALVSENDVICLTGSLYTVGEVPPDLWKTLLQERNFYQ